jgi:hypothetical protein
MSGAASHRLYNLLPAVYRLRDAAQGQPLRVLLSLIQQQYDAVEQDIAGLYENWFIETCQEWVVPYLGDLLGVRPLYTANTDTFSARAYVANTLDFRRRKGTAAMLEELALDVTGWPAHAVEFFQLLSTTQYLNHLRPQSAGTASLRDTSALELLGGPFDTITHTIDVRHLASGRGRHNLPNLGIFVWRLQDYLIGPVSTDPRGLALQGDARAAATPADGRYTFDPTGASAPLFNRLDRLARTNTTGLLTELDVPGPLRRRPLYDELEALRQSIADGVASPAAVYFGADPIFKVLVNGTAVPFAQVMICDLGDVSTTDWRRPAATKSYKPAGGGAPVSLPITVSVDPVRGRIAFPTGATPPASVQASYTYGFSANLGAGPHDRAAWLTDPVNGPPPLRDANRWQIGVSQEAPESASVVSTLTAAIQAWNQQPAGTDGVIAILDSSTYRETPPAAVIPAGSRLLIVAADWAAARQGPVPASNDLSPSGSRPHLLGALSVQGNAPGSSNPGQLFVDGLLVEGALIVQPGSLGSLALSHTTLTPGGGLQVLSLDSMSVSLYRCICGPIAFSSPPAPAPASSSQLRITDSIVTSGPASAATAAAITGAGLTANLQTTTVLGTTAGQIISASDSLFTGVVTATRQQAGCVRYSFVPVGSQTAQRYHCQPDLALTGVQATSQAPIVARLVPQFTSTTFAQPGFAQLSARGPGELATGADDGSEMGAFHFLQQPQRTTNVLTALDEYLRFGLEAGVIQET